jgi:hypothetical protein
VVRSDVTQTGYSFIKLKNCHLISLMRYHFGGISVMNDDILNAFKIQRYYTWALRVFSYLNI